MCRNIKPLFNFEPTATDEEIKAAALQYVRKISGYKTPSKVNEKAFNQAVVDISKVTKELILALQSPSTPKNREVEAQKARLRSNRRFN